MCKNWTKTQYLFGVLGKFFQVSLVLFVARKISATIVDRNIVRISVLGIFIEVEISIRGPLILVDMSAANAIRYVWRDIWNKYYRR